MKLSELLCRSENGSHFFLHYVRARREQSRHFSLRGLAAKLGYSNPSLVSEIVRGRRRANMDLYHRFTTVENLGQLERTYLANLIDIERSASKLNVDSKAKENREIRRFWESGDAVVREAAGGLELSLRLSPEGRLKAMAHLRDAFDKIAILSIEDAPEKSLCSIRAGIQDGGAD